MNGGAGIDIRQAMTRMQSRYTLKVVFSDTKGALAVADSLAVQIRGGELLIPEAGPWVLLKLPPGRYRLDAELGGKVQQKFVTVGSKLRTVNWVWPASLTQIPPPEPPAR